MSDVTHEYLPILRQHSLAEMQETETMSQRGFAEMPDWDDLRLFLAVARAESLSGAGRAVKLDAATLHRRIARLEAALKARLFVKGPQGYALSEEGLRLLPLAERAEAALAEVPAAVQGQSGELAGQIRIGAPDGCANYLLPQVLAHISEANPGLEIQIVAMPRVLNLSRREADMVIAVSRPEAGPLTVQKISDYHLRLAAHPDYLVRAGTPATRADLKDHAIVGYIPDMIFDRELDYLGETGAPPVRLASNSVAVQLNWLRAGAGIGVVHDFALHFAPELVPVLGNDVRLRRSFWLIRHDGDQKNERLNRFAALLSDGVRAEVARLEAQGR
jgi:DNA-binding transcriptional LysR family regulator